MVIFAAAGAEGPLPGLLHEATALHVHEFTRVSALIPNNLTMEITNRVSGASVSLSFANTDGGGANGRARRIAA
jgi:hypothetical protein